MSSSLTFLFKDIFPTKTEFKTFITDYDISNLSITANLNFAEYLYKILFRRYHNSNIQYDTIEDFKCDFANILEDSFKQYQMQLLSINKVYALTDAELVTINTALANQSNNPNSVPDDPTEPLEYISAQAFTIAKDNKLQAYMRAINNIPTQLIKAMLLRCVNLFKTILPTQIYVYTEEE